jgi:hypothetical protein
LRGYPVIQGINALAMEMVKAERGQSNRDDGRAVRTTRAFATARSMTNTSRPRSMSYRLGD